MAVCYVIDPALNSSLGLPAVASSYDDDSYPRTIVDPWDEEITIEEPIERIISLGNIAPRRESLSGRTDKLAGIDQPSYDATNYYSDLSNLLLWVPIQNPIMRDSGARPKS